MLNHNVYGEPTTADNYLMDARPNNALINDQIQVTKPIAGKYYWRGRFDAYWYLGNPRNWLDSEIRSESIDWPSQTTYTLTGNFYPVYLTNKRYKINTSTLRLIIEEVNPDYVNPVINKLMEDDFTDIVGFTDYKLTVNFRGMDDQFDTTFYYRCNYTSNGKLHYVEDWTDDHSIVIQHETEEWTETRSVNTYGTQNQRIRRASDNDGGLFFIVLKTGNPAENIGCFNQTGGYVERNGTSSITDILTYRLDSQPQNYRVYVTLKLEKITGVKR